ncbi:hypothetical protein MGN01_36120 [Methylobacterium gnaphalii]|uniref:Uncharacterized protein n=1 Tax=Methylobacterium gnaphalii TaxID=1010610 RepID=A0A512JP84_9HYPH|nr:hypothetical protein MGN01_36120 [Methylobacterium gnaphalii]GLS49598.1 hypothetical protein GCM10007885_24470 [Methylobacterium gnaphalii]
MFQHRLLAEFGITRRQLEALRALRTNPTGLRREAYPRVMPPLVVRGYAEVRPSVAEDPHERVPAWFLTPAGQRVLRAFGTGELNWAT